ncbi:hypothetical protein IPC1370_26285 [Pseudomonas aeruginosa]|uniref:hypothetical protein n=1 Tax=Pseudomonas aeruginosa TaxID=287 RepID=UPI000E09D49A|nr:hypothetical protein [Pseudomonas aeruginosa]EMF0865645.1 hypothetical protein [Pseudomonas aeruginosa]MCV4078964.1 hypothetical protein [Pseudomonas aeruginosa]MDP5442552.1 hypothetical protein [Pseudomonas aeruginosa]RUD64595.1 hypothetical protein IPC1370_26285 [Pseudomonas aeruginosa]TWV97061.1 hypothetical protein FQA91_06085 [Pseudomonas aeruginosa]
MVFSWWWWKAPHPFGNGGFPWFVEKASTPEWRASAKMMRGGLVGRRGEFRGTAGKTLAAGMALTTSATHAAKH